MADGRLRASRPNQFALINRRRRSGRPLHDDAGAANSLGSYSPNSRIAVDNHTAAGSRTRCSRMVAAGSRNRSCSGCRRTHRCRRGIRMNCTHKAGSYSSRSRRSDKRIRTSVSYNSGDGGVGQPLVSRLAR